MHASRCLVLIVLMFAAVAEAGKVKNALFSIFGSKEQKKPESDGFDDEQKDLMDWLSANGFGEYASKDWIEKFDDELAIDSIEDLTSIVEDDEYSGIGISKDVAIKMQEAARKHMLKYFLSSVPLPSGAAPGTYEQLLDKLLARGYDEPDDVADIEEDEADGLGIAKEYLKTLTEYADQWEPRQLFEVILKTYHDPKGGLNPFASEATWRPIVEAFIKAGAREMPDLMTVNAPTVSKEHMSLIHADPRVIQHAGKSEL